MKSALHIKAQRTKTRRHVPRARGTLPAPLRVCQAAPAAPAAWDNVLASRARLALGAVAVVGASGSPVPATSRRHEGSSFARIAGCAVVDVVHAPHAQSPDVLPTRRALLPARKALHHVRKRGAIALGAHVVSCAAAGSAVAALAGVIVNDIPARAALRDVLPLCTPAAVRAVHILNVEHLTVAGLRKVCILGALLVAILAGRKQLARADVARLRHVLPLLARAVAADAHGLRIVVLASAPACADATCLARTAWHAHAAGASFDDVGQGKCVAPAHVLAHVGVVRAMRDAGYALLCIVLGAARAHALDHVHVRTRSAVDARLSIACNVCCASAVARIWPDVFSSRTLGAWKACIFEDVHRVEFLHAIADSICSVRALWACLAWNTPGVARGSSFGSLVLVESTSWPDVLAPAGGDVEKLHVPRAHARANGRGSQPVRDKALRAGLAVACTEIAASVARKNSFGLFSCGQRHAAAAADAPGR